MSESIVIVIFLIMANLPWLTERVFFIYRSKNGKSAFLRLIELLVFYRLSLWLSTHLEIYYSGDQYPQGWEFIVTTFCLFLVLAVPGVIYRYQWLPKQVS